MPILLNTSTNTLIAVVGSVPDLQFKGPEFGSRWNTWPRNDLVFRMRLKNENPCIGALFRAR